MGQVIFAMVTLQQFRELAFTLPETEEVPHFAITSFRFKKKIFATLWEKENKAMLKLSLVDQSVFCAFDKTIFYPVPNKWGKQGATFIELSKVRKSMLADALACAYKGVNKKWNLAV